MCSQFASESAGGAVELAVTAVEGGGWLIRRPGEGGVERRTRDGAVRHVEWRMVRLAARAEQRMIHWHAAALTRGGHTILLPGRAGAGKSTLAVALAQRGFALLGEDVVFMDPLSREIHRFQRAIRLDGASRERLRAIGFEPDAARRVGSLVPFDEVASWSTRPSPPLSHVLFVEWGGEGGPVEVAPMTHAEGALELRERSHNLRRGPEGGWPLLRHVLAPARCYRLLRGEDLEVATAAIATLVDSGRP